MAYTDEEIQQAELNAPQETRPIAEGVPSMAEIDSLAQQTSGQLQGVLDLLASSVDSLDGGLSELLNTVVQYLKGLFSAANTEQQSILDSVIAEIMLAIQNQQNISQAMLDQILYQLQTAYPGGVILPSGQFNLPTYGGGLPGFPGNTVQPGGQGPGFGPPPPYTGGGSPQGGGGVNQGGGAGGGVGGGGGVFGGGPTGTGGSSGYSFGIGGPVLTGPTSGNGGGIGGGGVGSGGGGSGAGGGVGNVCPPQPGGTTTVIQSPGGNTTIVVQPCGPSQVGTQIPVIGPILPPVTVQPTGPAEGPPDRKGTISQMQAPTGFASKKADPIFLCPIIVP